MPAGAWPGYSIVYHDLRVQSGIVTRDDRRIDVAFSRCTSSRHSGVVARHPSGWGTSLLEGIFPLNEPIRARLFLLAPRPKSRRHHINKGWAWFEASGEHESERSVCEAVLSTTPCELRQCQPAPWTLPAYFLAFSFIIWVSRSMLFLHTLSR